MRGECSIYSASKVGSWPVNQLASIGSKCSRCALPPREAWPLEAARWGRPASLRPTRSCHLAPTFFWMAWIFSWKRLIVAWAWNTWVIGWLAWGRPGGLVLAHLGPMLHRHIDQWLYVVTQVGLCLGFFVCHCRWTQLDLVQAFRSWLVIFVISWLDLVFRTIDIKFHDEVPRVIGRLAWVFTQFGSFLDMLLLHLNIHQNFWNLLV